MNAIAVGVVVLRLENLSKAEVWDRNGLDYADISEKKTIKSSPAWYLHALNLA
ncbi:MAG: hypothetical protein OXC66_04500 [Roseovarius sp.]|nr:hypothetical protein [Roseovarius sp.]